MTPSPMNQGSYHDTLKDLLTEVCELREEIETNAADRLQKYKHYYQSGVFTRSALNLAHYLALRRRDRRHLQNRLARVGLSSLGRSEAYVLSTLNAVIELLRRATDKAYAPDDNAFNKTGFSRGQQLLTQHTTELFGPFRKGSPVHIMVTLGTNAAWDYEFVKDLLVNGMTCARINCAHDEPAIWQGMITNIRRAETETGAPCRILMDLAGHKIRTGPIASGPAIHRIKAKKDNYGNIISGGQVTLTIAGEPETPPAQADDPSVFDVTIPEALHQRLKPGALLGFIDAQNRQCYLRIEKALSDSRWLASCPQSAYLVSGCELTLFETDQTDEKIPVGAYKIGEFPGEPMEIRLFVNDLLLLTDNDTMGRPAERDENGRQTQPAQIGCTLPAFSAKLKVGQPVWFDDGKIGAVVESLAESGALLQITEAVDSGVKLQSDKGINFPETALDLSPLTEKDLTDLDFACAHADLIGFSFVETLEDMNYLIAELARRNVVDLPIIAKIETNLAVRNLPDILLGTLGRHSLGIMIARGDLAVELGSARLAEIQEELLWLCEAAHVPIIWATQVLESIAKKGLRSRPEFTDAAMAVRAECVMLNKGPYIIEAISALTNVMMRMQEHQRKKFSRLRALHW